MVIAPLKPNDRREWEILARGYKAFYKTPMSAEQYEKTWKRLLQATEIVGLGAKVDGQLLGIAHYLFHTTIWAPTSCYLQDLFTSPEARGKGVASALIETVADRAREAGADRFYWTTQDDNLAARSLYDKVAQYRGFVRYDYALDSKAA